MDKASIHVLYFASLREQLGCSEEQLPARYETVSELLSELARRGEVWSTVLLNHETLHIAVNHEIASRETRLQAGDEVAFFPPVTGG